jgi:hypothetical protein
MQRENLYQVKIQVLNRGILELAVHQLDLKECYINLKIMVDARG